MTAERPAPPPPPSPPGARGEILPAATLVVARPRHDGTAEIYMTRRSARSPFMPSTLVFPGGRVDAGDGTLDDASAWERAARRECAEEASLVITSPLRWFDTWITPSGEGKRRYHARFFLAKILADEGGDAVADGHETHDGRWASAAEHLALWESREADLPPPTLSTLLRLRAIVFSELDTATAADPAPPILPKVRLSAGAITIVMPHDPEYPTLPGDTLPAPARTRDLPLRFARDGQIWKPCP